MSEGSAVMLLTSRSENVGGIGSVQRWIKNQLEAACT